ncbi:MAG: hypothetical protein NC201_02355 [Prevotella sp.]|nr:hypothetical protein [Bacteroides sp.]MCM1366068.1 hypothetical protein [Prevotella sp.]MCM1436553.1 hypothetical protein [Prevotella sp.]
MKTRTNRNKRLQLISKLIRNRCICSQDQLISLLADNGCEITQGTLSRDLHLIKAIKVPTERGMSMYSLPESDSLKDKLLGGSHVPSKANFQSGFLSLELSGNMAVIKTRNGYAAGLAYEIDLHHLPEILGTIPGSDTIFAVMREDVTHEQAKKVFATMLPLDD